MSTKIKDVTKEEASVDFEKREFMGKVGKYAAVGAGMATLMTPTLSTAGNYSTVHQDNGRGNGDDPAPGGSLPNNGAENDLDGDGHQIHGDENPN